MQPLTLLLVLVLVLVRVLLLLLLLLLLLPPSTPQLKHINSNTSPSCRAAFGRCKISLRVELNTQGAFTTHFIMHTHRAR